MDVYCGYVRRYPCRNTLTVDEINGLLAELRPLATRVVNGYRTVWNGNNNVVVLNEDAQLADDEIKSRCYETFEEEAWDTYDWLEATRDELMFRISRGESISKIAEEIEDEAAREHMYLTYGGASTARMVGGGGIP